MQLVDPTEEGRNLEAVTEKKQEMGAQLQRMHTTRTMPLQKHKSSVYSKPATQAEEDLELQHINYLPCHLKIQQYLKLQFVSKSYSLAATKSHHLQHTIHMHTIEAKHKAAAKSTAPFCDETNTDGTCCTSLN